MEELVTSNYIYQPSHTLILLASSFPNSPNCSNTVTVILESISASHSPNHLLFYLIRGSVIVLFSILFKSYNEN